MSFVSPVNRYPPNHLRREAQPRLSYLPETRIEYRSRGRTRPTRADRYLRVRTVPSPR